VVPISKSTADYIRPLYCGDLIKVTVKPVALNGETYAIDYEMTKVGKPPKLVATVRTSHVCIDAKTRERAPLPTALAAWVSAG
jgi:1,4-dihydroxy-2-naphthoyl-CoA hydrolase